MKADDLQKVPVSDMQNLKTRFLHTECRWQVSILNWDNLTQPIQMQLSQKQKYFSYFIVDFWNEVQILNIFKKKMTLIGQIFPKLRTSENMVKSISKKFRFLRKATW